MDSKIRIVFDQEKLEESLRLLRFVVRSEGPLKGAMNC